jgi:NADH-quinone oxidoreductase subunit N
MRRDGRAVTRIDDLHMLSASQPTAALALLILMFSLARVPPLVGFWAKFAVLTAAIDAGLIWLAVGGVLASVIGAFYYLRIVYYMYFGTASDALDRDMPATQIALLGVSAALMVLGVVNLRGVERAAAAAAQALVR